MRLLVFLVFVAGAFSFIAGRLIGPAALPPIAAIPATLAVVLLFALVILQPLSWSSSGALRAFARRRLIRQISYVSIAFLSVLFALILARDALWLVAALARIEVSAYVPLSSAAIVIFSVLLTAWGHVSVRLGPRTVRLRVPIPGLPEPFAGFRIVQLSDIHIGESVRREHIERLVEKVNALDADLVAITGDLVDGSVPDLGPHAAPLAHVKSNHGTYFVAGNHEHYSGFLPWTRHLRTLGFNVLVNEHRLIERDGQAILIAGVDDLGATDDPEADLRASLESSPQEIVRVLLAHQPKIAPAASRAKFQLQLSGHTHGGQFLPWNFVAPLIHRFNAGLHRVGEMWLYVSRGTFYWGPPVRLLAPAEITVLELEPAQGLHSPI